jgi:hypothetical protein
MAEVPAEIITQLKEKYPDRSLHQVEKFDPGDAAVIYTFVMTGPTRDELDKLDQEMLSTDKVTDKLDKKNAIRSVSEKAAIAMIRWPERDEVKRIFGLHPEMVYSFVHDIRKFAGDSFETRTKKL